MFRIIGLWNDEEKYQDTPHNIGGQILNDLIKKSENNFLQNRSGLFFSKKRNSQISEGFIETEKGEKDFELILPKTFMNKSGDSLSGVLPQKEKERGKEIEKIIVIYDDIALPFGQTKISFGRGDGGHNGIKDIIKKVKSKNFIRIRIGVCPLDFFGKCRKPKGHSVSKYLTEKKFNKKQSKEILKIEKKVSEILEEILKNGYKKAMNRFN